MSTILLVEDNPHIMKINHTSLMMEGYDILEATTIAECRAALKAHDVDLIVLDIMLPDGNGVELCSELKHCYEIPILFLSALGENKDIIAALRAGGDDYLPKPYDINVLIARVEARLRSSNKQKRWFRFADLKLDTVSRIGYCRDQDLVLTQKEFSLLLQLARQGGRILPKEQLYEAVWGRPLATDSTALYTAISRLNAKLGEAQSETTISYLRGQGYMLETV
mgnify:FL=1